MLDSLNQIVLRIMDALLGWTLAFPRQHVLLALALFTAFVMVLIRKFTSNQELLSRCAADKKTLRALRREAKGRGDKEAVARINLTTNQISVKAMSQEWRPLLFSLLPIIFLTTWMWQRLAFIPAQPNQPCVLRAEFPISASGRLAHLVPDKDVRVEGGWVKPIEVTAGLDADSAGAQWTLKGKPGAHVLTVRYGGHSYEHPIVLDGSNYREPVLEHDDHVRRIELVMQPTKLFGVVPGLDALGLAPWMVGYLIVAIVAVPLFKRMLAVR